MIATVCLISCALCPAQPASGAEWLLIPRLSRGQELVYRGTVTEESIGRGVQTARTYRLQARLFVLDSSPQGSEVALFTTLKQRAAKSDANDLGLGNADPGSVRLETAQFGPQGRLMAESTTALLVPMTGPPTIEWGAIIEAPKTRVMSNQKWEVIEEGRPARTWTVSGTEMMNGTRFVKLIGTQQSADWEQPRADRSAWRRQDIVWMSPQLGVAVKVERTIEHREPARREPSQRITASYDLDNNLVYPGELFEDRCREIAQFRAFFSTAEPLWREPAKYQQKSFEALLAKINYHLENRPPTPYRDAVLLVKRRVEAARNGQTPPVSLPEAASRPTVATVGQLAPDFVTTGLTNKQPVRLQRLLGRPILMVFYNPMSRTAEDLLRFAQGIHDKNGTEVTVLAMAVSEDADAVMKQYGDLKLSFPVLLGKSLRFSYAVESTPKLVVLDAEGMVRGAYIGWGREIPIAVADDLKRWQRTTSPSSNSIQSTNFEERR